MTITNSGSRVYDYTIEVVAVSSDGATQYESSFVLASSLQPGQSSEQDAMFFEELPAGAVFEVVEVSRTSF